MMPSRIPRPTSTFLQPRRYLVTLVLLLLNNYCQQSSARAPCFGRISSPFGGHHRFYQRNTHHDLNRYRGGSSAQQNTNTNPNSNQLQNTTTSSDSITSNNNATTSTFQNQTITTIPEWKRAFPEPLCSKSSRTFQRIIVPYQNQVAEIYLLGTAHVSNDSSRDVHLLLNTLHPNVIFVELCDQRTSMLEDPPLLATNKNHSKPFWQKVTDVQLHSNHSRFQSMATVLLTQTQEEYAESLGVELGGEFRVAYKYWRAWTPAQQRPHLILGDRPLAITLARAWESLSWFGKIKVLVGLIISSLQKPKPEELRKWIQSILEDEETDLLKSSLEDLRKHFPTLERVIIRERDAYMACKLYQLCRGLLVSAARRQQQQQQTSDSNAAEETARPIVIVALVGAGHVPGICEWLTTKTHPQGPEDLLATLIATKKFAHEDLSALVYDVTELHQDYGSGVEAVVGGDTAATAGQ